MGLAFLFSMHMIVLVLFLAGLVATTAMTVFSYLLSMGTSHHFREPELLNSLMAASDVIPPDPPRNSLWGWTLHYAIGWIFVVLFHVVWQLTPLSPGVASGAGLGFVAGVIGITGWQIMFALSSDPPSIRFRPFLLHLLFAHMLFGISAALVYAWGIPDPLGNP